ncbi:MAG: amidohydrolase family protein [Planctomycetaceae bacterium]
MAPSGHHSATAGLSRRQLLTAAATVTATAALSQTASLASHTTNLIPAVDTHQHLWDLNRLTLPWLKGAPEILRHNYGLPEYAQATAGLNVVQAVYMEVDVRPEDHVLEAETLVQICRSGNAPTIAAVISGRPGLPAFEPYIKGLSKSPEIRGVRQVLHSPDAPRAMCLESQFVKSVKLLGELNLSFDLCMRPTELSDGLKLARLCPDTRFVLDHCGNAAPAAFLPEAQRAGKTAAHDPKTWRDDIKALADCPNVICKISGVIASAPQGVPFTESLGPIVNHCLDAFGPDRVVFGGDWPVCLLGGSYKDWLTTLRTLISSRPLEHQQKLLHANARRFYRLPEPAAKPN